MTKYFFLSLSIVLFCGNVNAQWQKTNGLKNVSINSIAIKGSDIFIGTDGSGILKSSDNGDSWFEINSGIADSVIHVINVIGANIFVGTNTGIYLSNDNGFTWSASNNGLDNKGVWSLCQTGEKILAGTWSGVYISLDNGKNWSSTALKKTSMPVNSIILGIQNVYSGTAGGGIFRFSGNGTGPEEIFLKGFVKDDPRLPLIVPAYSLIATGPYVLVGTTYGEVSRFIDGLKKVESYFLGSNKSVCSFASIDTNTFAGTDGDGVFLSIDNGESWAYIGLRYSSIKSLAVGNSYLFAGTKDGIWRRPLSQIITGIDKEEKLPDIFSLSQNYPNPFNPTTTIGYSLQKESKIILEVFDMLGRHVATLVDEIKPAGNYNVTFNASGLSSGMYVYRLMTGNQIFTRKMLLSK